VKLAVADRQGLVARYSELCTDDADRPQLLRLGSAACARARDPAQFKRTPFEDVPAGHATRLRAGPLELDWLDADAATPLVNTVRLDGLGVAPIAYCERRAEFLHRHVGDMAALCAEELDFIQQFTATLVWLAPRREDAHFGNSSFYLAPHVTFVSDGTLFFIAPQRQIPRQFGGYGFIENLFHEALHHQVHAHCALTRTHYCVEDIDAFRELLDFPCRPDRTFTLFQAINAYHVYGFIAPLRLRVYTALARSRGERGARELDWLLEGARSALQLWLAFGAALNEVQHKLLPQWRDLVADWAGQAEAFAAAHPHLQVRTGQPVMVAW
jgi:hypothetical protein